MIGIIERIIGKKEKKEPVKNRSDFEGFDINMEESTKPLRMFQEPDTVVRTKRGLKRIPGARRIVG